MEVRTTPWLPIVAIGSEADPSGTTDRGDGFDGVSFGADVSHTAVGGSTPDKHNLNAGNDIHSVLVVFS